MNGTYIQILKEFVPLNAVCVCIYVYLYKSCICCVCIPEISFAGDVNVSVFDVLL